MENKGSIAALILAAGKSERMGRPKPLLPLAGSTFLGHLLGLVRGAAEVGPVRVVLGAFVAEVTAAIPLAAEELVINRDYEQGMLSSLQAGLRAVLPLAPAAVMLFPVDHPNLDPATIAAVAGAFCRGEGEIILPRHGERRGHPVLFAASLFEALLAAPPEVGARHVVRAFPEKVLELEVPDPGVLQDIDTPADYRALTGREP